MPEWKYHVPEWKYHVGKVSVRFMVYGDNWDPDRVLQTCGLQPTESARPHQNPRLLPFSEHLVGGESAGIWVLDTAAHVNSKDVKEHFQYLLDAVLPRLEQFNTATQGTGRAITLDWESTLAGTVGPELPAAILSGLAQLKATLTILVHRIDEAAIS